MVRHARCPGRVNSGAYEKAPGPPAPSYPQSRAPTGSGQVGPRVYGASVEDDHEVIVRPGRPPGHADVADDLSRCDELTDPDRRWVQRVIHVARERRGVVARREDHDRRG